MEASTKNEFAVRIGRIELRATTSVPDTPTRHPLRQRVKKIAVFRDTDVMSWASKELQSCRATRCPGRVSHRKLSRAGRPGFLGTTAQQHRSARGDAVAAGGGPDKGQVEAATSNDGSTARLRL
jgi:hypothetical protein